MRLCIRVNFYVVRRSSGCPGGILLIVVRRLLRWPPLLVHRRRSSSDQRRPRKECPLVCFVFVQNRDGAYAADYRRIHPESYVIALRLALDALDKQSSPDLPREEQHKVRPAPCPGGRDSLSPVWVSLPAMKKPPAEWCEWAR